MPTCLHVLLITTVLVTVIGCSQPADERLVALGRAACDRQAEQNRLTAQQSEQVAALSRDFIDGEAKARQEMAALQHQLIEADAQAQAAIAAERQHVDRQRAELDQERRQIAEERHRAPLVAAAITQIGLLVACVLPLALAGYMLYVLQKSGDSGDVITELFVDELLAEQPRLLPGPAKAPALPSASSPAGDAGNRAIEGYVPLDP